jgi:flagellar biosynthesis protein
MARKKDDRLIAAAIKYDAKKDPAPRLTAKGRGVVAEKIIEVARQNNIPIKEDSALVQILYQLDVEECIPPELYKAIAEILVFVYSLNEQWRTQHSSNSDKSRITSHE